MSGGRPVDDPICMVDDIPDGAARGVDPLGQGRDTMFVVRRGEKIFGWRNFCPHQGHEQMAWEKDAFLTHDSARIVCGAHGAQYEIDSGVCVAGPCVGKALTAVALEIREGQVYVAGPYSRRAPMMR